jgi:hypothetical protein
MSRAKIAIIAFIFFLNTLAAPWTYMESREAILVQLELESCRSVSKEVNQEAWRLMDSVREASRKMKFIKRNGP